MWSTNLRLWCSILFILLFCTRIIIMDTTITPIPDVKLASFQTSEILSENATTEPTTTATIPTTTITPEACGNIGSNGIDVENRTSDMFAGYITYNCSFINWNSLTIEYNDSSAICDLTQYFLNSTRNGTVIVTCYNITNNAGRDWSFTIHGTSIYSNVSINETFTTTLEPKPLNTSTSIIITVHENLTSASIFVPNCKNIADSRDLVIRCNSSDMPNNTLSDNCTYICLDLKPGSNNTVSLVRLPIQIADKPSDTFPQDTRTETYKIKLDKVTNLKAEGNLTENRTAIFHFDCPRQYYEEVRVICIAQNQTCDKSTKILTNSIANCSNPGSISISPMARGVNYECQAVTIKESFDNATSNKTNFTTALEPVLHSDKLSFNTSFIIFNITTQSDYDSINSTCTVADYQSSPCNNLIVQDKDCFITKAFKLNGTLGCDYKCLFVTQKINYIDKNSTLLNLTIDPPKPKITETGLGSRWISVNITIDEIAYIDSFGIFINSSYLVDNLTREANFSITDTTFSYNYTGLQPYQNYMLHVVLNSNRQMLSEDISRNTLQEAPGEPSPEDVMQKIIPIDNHEESTTTQHVIEIDSSLFSNAYGPVRKYLIYVRQDQNNNDTEIYFNGTYAEACQNTTFDYLALEIPMLQSRSTVLDNARNITVTLGNETDCLNASITTTPCNGELRASTTYRIIVSGCTDAGCTNVISTEFRTQNPIPPIKPKPGSSKAWVVVFPLLALAIVAGLVVWKRKNLKRLYNNKFKKTSHDLRSSTVSLPCTYNPATKRPKPLSSYINMTKEDEKAIYDEFQALDQIPPPNRQSEIEETDYAIYNRYANIPARGAWESTAVKLTAAHRMHDYINANEIKGFYSNKQYIACQGPLKDTCQDFWDMIVQYKVLKIVMLTRTEERNPHNPKQKLAKCHSYFPEDKGQSLKFGIVDVLVTEIENRPEADLEIRHILIKDGTTEHRVCHYYFTGWPDFSVVEQRKLLDLIETVNKHEENGSMSEAKTRERLLTPIVVHCSAGVGRTGTYIAVDIIMHLLDRPHYSIASMELDVMGIVHQMRQDRGKMVQTRDQYMLVNRCVEEYLRRTNRLSSISKGIPIYENDHVELLSNSDNLSMSYSKQGSLDRSQSRRGVSYRYSEKST